MLVIGEFHWDLSELVTIQIPEGGRERDLEREGERERRRGVKTEAVKEEERKEGFSTLRTFPVSSSMT